MAHDWNGPQVDDRSSHFGLGFGFSMIGPSRLVMIGLSTPPVPPAWDAECLPFWRETWVTPIRYECVWAGTFVDHSSSCLLRVDFSWPPKWTWDYRQVQTPPAPRRRALFTFTDFKWNRTGFDLNWNLPTIGVCGIQRIAEWQTVSERFPSVTIGQELP